MDEEEKEEIELYKMLKKKYGNKCNDKKYVKRYN